MAFVVKNRVYGTIQEVQWQGRCGFIRLRLEQGKTESLTVPDIVILGVHGAHGDEICQTLTDLATLVHQALKHASQLFLVGDWNIDQLPCTTADPWSNTAGRLSHHRSRRDLLGSFFEKFKLERTLPTTCSTSPGGPFGNFQIGNPD